MKVAIVEAHYHHEFLNTLIQLFDNPSVYTLHEVYDNLPQSSKDKAHFIFYNYKQPAKDFIDAIPTQDFDYIFVNTIQPSMVDLPKWKHFKPKCKAILTLHNLNAWYNRKFHLRKNILRSVDSYLASRYCEKILKKFEIINVTHHPMMTYAHRYFGYQGWNILCIPYALAKDNAPHTSKEAKVIDFVIPGTVEMERRNYQILDVFQDLMKKYDNIYVILLGKISKQTREKLIGSRDDANFIKRVITCDDFVPQGKYDATLNNADFVVCPVVEKTHTISMVDETYGKTKSSNYHEAVKWRKPLIIPDYFLLDDRLKTSTIAYKDGQDLFDTLDEFLNEPKNIERIKEEAIKNTDYYTYQNTYKRLNKLLSEGL